MPPSRRRLARTIQLGKNSCWKITKISCSKHRRTRAASSSSSSPSLTSPITSSSGTSSTSDEGPFRGDEVVAPLFLPEDWANSSDIEKAETFLLQTVPVAPKESFTEQWRQAVHSTETYLATLLLNQPGNRTIFKNGLRIGSDVPQRYTPERHPVGTIEWGFLNLTNEMASNGPTLWP